MVVACGDSGLWWFVVVCGGLWWFVVVVSMVLILLYFCLYSNIIKIILKNKQETKKK